MVNNVTFQAATLATPPNATVVETIDEGAGVERQVICLGSLGKAGAETAIGANIPTASVGLGAFATGQVTVGNTATQIVGARTGAPGTGRSAVTIVNHAAVDVFIGGAGVTTGTGYLLPAGKGNSITVPTTAAVYGIVAAGNETVSFFETY